MTQPVSGAPGETTIGDGSATQSPLRTGRLNDLIASQLRGRWYEQTFRGRIFSASMALTSIAAATFTNATLGATATPIAGIWNPYNSGVNAEVLAAILNTVVTAATSTGCGGFGWYYETGITNVLPATGAAGLSGYQPGAKGKVQNMAGVALTGLPSNLALLRASALEGGSLANFSFVGTAVGQVTGQSGTSWEPIDGSIIMPPGSVLALLCGTTPVAHSAWSSLLYAEVPPA